MGTVNQKKRKDKRDSAVVSSSGGDGGGVGRDYEEQTIAEGWNRQTSGRYTESVLRLL
jgi:hypothetical protein